MDVTENGGVEEVSNTRIELPMRASSETQKEMRCAERSSDALDARRVEGGRPTRRELPRRVGSVGWRS